MTLDLQRLRTLASSADPCTWSVHADRDGTWSVCTAHGAAVVYGIDRETATVIAESKNALGPLCDRVSEVERENERLRRLIKVLRAENQRLWSAEGTTEP